MPSERIPGPLGGARRGGAGDEILVFGLLQALAKSADEFAFDGDRDAWIWILLGLLLAAGVIGGLYWARRPVSRPH